MKNRFCFLIYSLFIVPLLAISCQQGKNPTSSLEQKPVEMRIISLSGFLTEVLSDLGYADQIIGRDVTSTYPASIHKIPSLGHVSQLNTEAILALKPSIIFVEKQQVAKAEALAQLKQANIKVVEVPTSTYLNNAVKAAKLVGKHLETDAAIIQKIESKITTDSLKLVEVLNQSTDQPKVLFIYARGAGRLMVAGTNTSAQAIIEKAGGENAIQSFEDFRNLTPEALVEAAPEVILMFFSGLESLDGKAGLATIPGIQQTTAFQKDRIIAMDGHYLTAFGPRAAQAAIELAEQIHFPKTAMQ